MNIHSKQMLKVINVFAKRMFVWLNMEYKCGTWWLLGQSI